jgi:hypothetical protein
MYIREERRAAKVEECLNGAGWFIFSGIKKGENRRSKLSLYNYVKSGKSDIVYMKNSPHVPLRQITEEKRRGKELRVV